MTDQDAIAYLLRAYPPVGGESVWKWWAEQIRTAAEEKRTGRLVIEAGFRDGTPRGLTTHEEWDRNFWRAEPAFRRRA